RGTPAPLNQARPPDRGPKPFGSGTESPFAAPSSRRTIVVDPAAVAVRAVLHGPAQPSKGQPDVCYPRPRSAPEPLRRRGRRGGRLGGQRTRGALGGGRGAPARTAADAGARARDRHRPRRA